MPHDEKINFDEWDSTLNITWNITVTVKPNSKKESVTKLEEGMYLVRVHAAPVDGKANDRVIELLCLHFGKPKSAFILLKGHKSKKKTFQII
jgi:uncharacterized protein (TIGR00251 family)